MTSTTLRRTPACRNGAFVPHRIPSLILSSVGGALSEVPYRRDADTGEAIQAGLEILSPVICNTTHGGETLYESSVPPGR